MENQKMRAVFYALLVATAVLTLGMGALFAVREAPPQPSLPGQDEIKGCSCGEQGCSASGCKCGCQEGKECSCSSGKCGVAGCLCGCQEGKACGCQKSGKVAASCLGGSQQTSGTGSAKEYSCGCRRVGA
ncbi:MAG: hypothetical protein N3G22_05030 [Candidatus Micrarchaeota archaeon]|nr:hypothetical protein [Candidatus Micrarchaeota archaeon]